MRFERAHLPLGPSAGGGAVAHQPSQPIGNLGSSRRFKERKKKRAPNTTQIATTPRISRILSELGDRKRPIDDPPVLTTKPAINLREEWATSSKKINLKMEINRFVKKKMIWNAV